jgi:hypothetical protein
VSAVVSPRGAGPRSVVTILRGVVDVTRLDPRGRPVGAPVRVNPLERIKVEASGSLPAPERITAEAAAGLYEQFRSIPRDVPRGGREVAASVAADLARMDALQLGGAAVSVGGTPGAASPTVGTGSISVPVPGAAAALPVPVDVPSITNPLPSSAPLPNLLPSTPPLPSPPPLSAPLPNLLPSTPPLPSPPPLSAPLPNLLPSTPPLPSPPPLSAPLPNLLPSTPPLPSPALPKLSPPKLLP